MFLDILKMGLALLGGGLAGAILTDWLRRRGGRLQSIPLVERVNRVVNPDLEGFTLARVTGGHDHRQLEEIRNVREYQFTLRNTSTVHLQGVEVQFEFPAEDMEGYAERPALSKTTPVLLECPVASPWKKGFRWQIPRLPSSDSIEFSFRAVDPPSGDYEVALYNTDRIVIERSKGEPVARKRGLHSVFSALIVFLALLWGFGILVFAWPGSGIKATTLRDGGCSLVVTSMYGRVAPGSSTWPWSGGPWEVTNRILNVGSHNCEVRSDQIDSSGVPLSPGRDAMHTAYFDTRPRLTNHKFLYGTDSPTHSARVPFYDGPR